MKNSDVVPFEEWKSRLLSRGLSCNAGGTQQVCAYELDGDQEQWMFNEYTSFPHFGQVMAEALDPKNHHYPTLTHFMFGYADPTGNPVFGMNPETNKDTGIAPDETFEGARFEMLYFDYVLWVDDYDHACRLAWEMYRRRRLPTAKTWEQCMDEFAEKEDT